VERGVRHPPTLPVGSGRVEGGGTVGLTRHFLIEAERRWESRRLRMFTFERAAFREADA
jgi:hypothetical protein